MQYQTPKSSTLFKIVNINLMNIYYILVVTYYQNYTYMLVTYIITKRQSQHNCGCLYYFSRLTIKSQV